MYQRDLAQAVNFRGRAIAKSEASTKRSLAQPFPAYQTQIFCGNFDRSASQCSLNWIICSPKSFKLKKFNMLQHLPCSRPMVAFYKNTLP
jgi:hypothetical protein